MKMQDVPKTDRPREKLIQKGPSPGFFKLNFLKNGGKVKEEI